jgi:hypothetical protein
MFNNKWLNESEMGDVTSETFVPYDAIPAQKKPYWIYGAKEMAEMTKWFMNHRPIADKPVKSDSFSSF